MDTLRIMGRKLSVEYPGAVYHVLHRSDRREDIFRDHGDRQRFVDTLAGACDKTGWQVHALCLMSNHFHLVVETPQPDLVAGVAPAGGMGETELKGRGWEETDLAQRAKGDVGKGAMAMRLRAESTTMTVKWIAARLQMGTPGCANLLLHQKRKSGKAGYDNIKNPFKEPGLRLPEISGLRH